MNISTNWVNDYVKINDLNLNDLALKITNSGVNVEAVKKQVEATNLVIGHVKKREDHPNSDHLNVCQVDLGEEIVQIICGAYNVDKGQKVIVSKVGAVLPGNFEIKKSTIRGQVSNGMICALSELGLEDEIKDGIHVLPEDAPVGGNPLEYLGLDDTIYTLDLNPNRKTDCTNHLGFAYEVGAVIDRKVIKPEISFTEIKENIKDEINLKVETEKCSMYLAKLVKNVEIKDSPEFIKKRLLASNMRPINNVVDISNFIMLEYGQPLHFFDADKLGKNILVRDAKDGEETVTLDNKSRVLNHEDIVITDGENIACIAGVMGSLNTEVTKDTKNILIESAIFEPLSIRYTSLKLDLRSEAALRYERGLNYEYTLEALKRACHLLERYANACVCSGELVHDKVKKEEKIAKVTVDKINKVIGAKIEEKDICNYFERLGFEYKLNNKEFTVTIPKRRLDVSMREDLIEEVGRLYGYENIEATVSKDFIKQGGYEPRTKYRKDVSKLMRSLNLNEVRTYTLVSKKDADAFNYDKKDLISLQKPINSERTELRTSIIPSLLEVFNYNSARKMKNIHIYEISNVYSGKNKEYKEEMKLAFLTSGNYVSSSWQKSLIKSDFYLAKALIENVLNFLGFNKRYKFSTDNLPEFLHPGMSAVVRVDKEIVGYLGKIHPQIKNKDIYVGELNLEKLFNKKTSKLKFKKASIYPSVKRDVAFLIDKDLEVENLITEINKNGSKILTNIEVFDVYEKEDKKSIAFSLTFEDFNKTLTEEEINNVFNKIIDKVCNKFNAELRNK